MPMNDNDRQSERDKQTHIQIDRETYRDIDRQVKRKRQTDRETSKQTVKKCPAIGAYIFLMCYFIQNNLNVICSNKKEK